jgi:transcriptional regulator NrdR family protein
MYVIKRDGTQVPFNHEKIINAIDRAFIEVDG